MLPKEQSLQCRLTSMTSVSSLSYLISLTELAVDGNPLAALQSSAAVRLEVIARSPSSLDMLDGRQVSWAMDSPQAQLACLQEHTPQPSDEPCSWPAICYNCNMLQT